jgi:hypothetical protein
MTHVRAKETKQQDLPSRTPIATNSRHFPLPKKRSRGHPELRPGPLTSDGLALGKAQRITREPMRRTDLDHRRSVRMWRGAACTADCPDS